MELRYRDRLACSYNARAAGAGTISVVCRCRRPAHGRWGGGGLQTGCSHASASSPRARGRREFDQRFNRDLTVWPHGRGDGGTCLLVDGWVVVSGPRARGRRAWYAEERQGRCVRPTSAGTTGGDIRGHCPATWPGPRARGRRPLTLTYRAAGEVRPTGAGAAANASQEAPGPDGPAHGRRGGGRDLAVRPPKGASGPRARGQRTNLDDLFDKEKVWPTGAGAAVKQLDLVFLPTGPVHARRGSGCPHKQTESPHMSGPRTMGRRGAPSLTVKEIHVQPTGAGAAAVAIRWWSQHWER